MGLCVNYDVSMQAVNELSARTRLPGQSYGISATSPFTRTIINGGPGSLSDGKIPGSTQVIGETGSVRNYYDKGPEADNAPTNASPQDSRALAEQRLGVQGTTIKLPDLNFGFLVPPIGERVTQPARVGIERNDESLND